MAQTKLVIVFLSVLLLALAGCAKEAPVEPKELELIVDEPVAPAPEVDMEEISPPAAEPSVPEEHTVEKLDEPKTSNVTKFTTPTPEPSNVERDTCGCSLKWDPICGKNKKTWVNKCIYQCFGNDLADIELNNKCPMTTGPIDINVDDREITYESDKWNGGYCWRQMYRDSGLRYCENLIVNGRLNFEPAPLKGNWIESDSLVEDIRGKKESYSIKAKTGDRVWQEEYILEAQPIFENGEYTFSFWARNDITSNNDWYVKLTLKDWWDAEGPVGVNGCYQVYTLIRGEEHFFEEEPNKWRHYHYSFDVPLDFEQWTGYKRESPLCEYDWDMVPHGYKIEVVGPTFGHAYFDDFSLMKD